MSRETLALVGARGMLAWKVQQQATPDLNVELLSLPEFDITNRDRVLDVLGSLRPAAIVNCAAVTDVDGCESREELANAANGRGPGYLAEAALETGAILVHLSTDYVFDGTKGSPYVEDDPTGPTSAYGRSKLLGERAVLDSGLERFFIVRTSWLYGPRGKNFVEAIARLAREREELRVVADQMGSPTYTTDLARAMLDLVALSRSSRFRDFGVYHVSNEGMCTWHEFAEAIVDELRRTGQPLNVERIVPIRTEQYPLPAKRPAYSVLSKERYRAATGALLPHWREALTRYMQERSQERGPFE